MNIPLAWLSQLEVYAVVLARVVGLLVVAPFFSSSGVPALLKTGFAALIAALLVGPLGTIGESLPSALANPGAYVLLLAGELFIGAALGFIVLLILVAVQVAGQMLDIPMGFGMVNVLDPQTGTQVPVLGQFKFVLAMLVFFTVNAHHTVLRALAESYQSLPIGSPVATGFQVGLITSAVAHMFLLGVRIALPVMAAAFLIDVALGIVSRAVPQINVFITGFPLKILGGMMVLVIILPAYVALIGWAFGTRGEMVRFLWDFMSGG